MKDIKNEMVSTLQKVIHGSTSVDNNKNLSNLLEEYGFDSHRCYNKRQMFFVDYAIRHCHGLKNKLKAAVSLFVIDNLVNYIVEDNPSYEDLGSYCYDILEDCRIIELKLPKED